MPHNYQILGLFHALIAFIITSPSDNTLTASTFLEISEIRGKGWHQRHYLIRSSSAWIQFRHVKATYRSDNGRAF